MTTSATPAPAPEPWCRNLLHTHAELVDHLRDVEDALAGPGDPAPALDDACLTLCALSQVLDDFVHRGFLALAAVVEASLARPEKLQHALDFLPERAAAGAAALLERGGVRTLARMADAAAGARVHARAAVRERRLVRTAHVLHQTTIAAAAACQRPDRARAADVRRLLGDVRRMLAPTVTHPALAARVLKVPSCFKDLDVHPDDCRRLAERFAATRPDRSEPVTVLGIRTSGSYIAPVCAAALRELGWRDVAVATIRPRVPLLAGERRLLRRRGRAGPVLVVDDPPVTGGSLAAVVRALRALGIPPSHAVPLVMADSGSDGAAPGDGTERIVLPKAEWRIQRTLGDVVPAAVVRSLGMDAVRVEPLPPSARGDADGAGPYHCRRSRCHEKVRLVAGGVPGPERPAAFAAKGIGVGWFADYARDVARALPEFVPPRLDAPDGVLVTRWVDAPSLAERPEACGETVVRSVARYVAARQARLPIRSGPAGDVADRDTGWHVLARTFARSFSFLAPLAYGWVRRRLDSGTTPRAAIDGHMGPSEWLLAEARPPVKVDFEEHAFDRMDLAVLDPVYDLASFAVENRLSRALVGTLVEEYVARSGDHDAAARMARCELVAGLSAHAELGLLLAAGGSVSHGFGGEFDARAVAIARAALERHLSTATNAFLASLPEHDTEPPAPHTLFAVDVDGVLEDNVFGFSATTPAGIRAIRTLARHGFAVVPASGRSAGEIEARCRTFGLAAGIAEYGSVVWLRDASAPISLVADAERAQLDALRTLLARMPDPIMDPAYTASVRIFCCRAGVRRAVSHAWVEDLLRRHGLDALRTVPGDDQIDVVGRTCDKGRAVLAVRERLGLDRVEAVGDTADDLSMLRIADRAWAPANVRPAVRAALPTVRVARGRRQLGLLEIARLAAHGRPADCDRCRRSASAPRDAALVWALALRDRSRALQIAGVARHGTLRMFRASV